MPPAQLVTNAHDHPVESRPLDVNHGHRDNTLEPIVHTTALHLGFRQIKGARVGDITCPVA